MSFKFSRGIGYFVCDERKCRRFRTISGRTALITLDWAQQFGWSVEKNRILCPRCAKKREGKGAA